jgi:hypothetical protein
MTADEEKTVDSFVTDNGTVQDNKIHSTKTPPNARTLTVQSSRIPPYFPWGSLS